MHKSTRLLLTTAAMIGLYAGAIGAPAKASDDKTPPKAPAKGKNAKPDDKGKGDAKSCASKTCKSCKGAK